MDVKSLVLGVILGVAPSFIWWLVKPPEPAMEVLWLGMKWYWTFTRRDKLRNLERYRALLERIHQRPYDYYGHLLDVVLFTLIAMTVGGILCPFLARLPLGPQTQTPQIIVTLFQGVADGFAVAFAIGGLRFHQDVQRYDTAIMRLNQQIASLQAKLPHARRKDA
jgi:4-amino-4-deoxy-L-arabinose transferase-like glycosyltransferase